MAIRLNKTFIAGNLTRDPEIRFLSNEKAVGKFGLACNRTFKKADGEQGEEVLFIDVECWGRTAELVGQYLTKGKPCLVEGRLKQDTWEDKDGNKRSKILIVAEAVQFLGGKQDGEERTAQQQSKPAGGAPIADDEPPFMRKEDW